VTSFWNIVQFLYVNGDITAEGDFSIRSMQTLKCDALSHEWVVPKRVIFIQHSRIFPLYQKHGKNSGEKTLPKESIDFYIRNDRRFLGRKKCHNFWNINPKTGQRDEKDRWKVTVAYAFDYDALNDQIGITLHSDQYTDDDQDLFKMAPEKNEEIPY